MIKSLFKGFLSLVTLTLITTSALAVPDFYVQHAAQPWNSSPNGVEWYWTPAYEPASVLLRLDTTPVSCQPVTVSIGSQMQKNKTYILRVVFIYGFRDYNQHWYQNYYPHAFGNVSVWDGERIDWVERQLPTPPMDWYGDYIVGCDYKIRAVIDPSNGEVILSAFLLNTVYGWKPDIESPTYAPAVYTVQEVEDRLGHPCIVGGW